MMSLCSESNFARLPSSMSVLGSLRVIGDLSSSDSKKKKSNCFLLEQHQMVLEIV